MLKGKETFRSLEVYTVDIDFGSSVKTYFWLSLTRFGNMSRPHETHRVEIQKTRDNFKIFFLPKFKKCRQLQTKTLFLHPLLRSQTHNFLHKHTNLSFPHPSDLQTP
jgi:hypothetical protein